MDGRKEVKRPPHPKAKAGLLSTLTFSWVLPIFYRGFKKEMEPNDLFEPLPEYKSNELGDRFEEEWYKEVKRAKENNRKPQLIRVLIRIFWMRNAAVALTAFVLEIGVRTLIPFFIGLLVRYFNTQNSSLPEPGPDDATYIMRIPEILGKQKTQMSFNEALFFAGAIAVNSILTVFLFHPYIFYCFLQGMQCRVGVCSLIYRKALRLSSTALQETTAGQMVNLLSNDVNRFDLSTIFLHYLWIGPIECLIISYFLYPVVEWSTFLGVAFVVLQIPFQVYMSKKSSEYRLKTAIRTDERVRLMNEIVSGIQVIKMYAWEMPFSALVKKSRKYEIREIKGSSNIRALIMSMFLFSSRLAVFVTIVGFALTGKQITADIMFLVIAFYNTMKDAMTEFFPLALNMLAETSVSIKRLEKFLLFDENQTHNLNTILKDLDMNGMKEKSAPVEVRFQNASFKWLKEGSEPTLMDLSFNTPAGDLLVVIGPVGAGKSSLLQAVLKEIPLISGSLLVKGSISYASQEPWLFSGSIRQNILFGLPYDRNRYKEVIEVCALERDFELFPDGDKTVVGERGTSLSGGQRARINLARAVYKQADIYLLDDPLSAVDTHVGKHLFEDCITGYLRGKTVILVTHQLQYLTECKHILLLHNGKIDAQGVFEEVQRSGMAFAQVLQQGQKGESGDEASEKAESHRSRKDSLKSTLTEDEAQNPELPEETRVIGKLHWKVYYEYLKASKSFPLMFSFVLLLCSSQIMASLSDWWGTKWSEDTEKYLNKTVEERDQMTLENIYIFSALNVGGLCITILRSLLFFAMCRRISQNLHDVMFKRVTCSPMKFFHDNPSGRILNRFSKDMGAIDELLPQTMIDCLQVMLGLLAVIIICAMISPILIAPTSIILLIIYLFRVIFVTTSRNVRRLEGTTRSPVFSHLNASLQGLTTIRAFGAQSVLQNEFDSFQDLHSTAWYLFISSSRSFAFWLDFVTVTYTAIVCFVMVCLGNNGPEAGLAITQSIGLTGMFQWCIRQTAELENQMTSVERVLEYTNMTQEPPLESEAGKKPPPSWPSKGNITFENVVLRYDPEGEPILHNVSFNIEPQEKIGIVGRTGAGKSSLIAAMFRLAYIEGKITIDSVETSKIGLHDLRSKISIIPQEPVLFSGTLRRNLDPFDEYPDWCLWNALEEVELKEVVSEFPEGLSAKMSEGGSNFSVGQRQLMCLARAIVRNNKILIMDEATANVDPQTDQLIQRTIRKKFTDCTVLTIAHRLHTVMDSDRILVMDAGQSVELAHPYHLLSDPLSLLAQLVKQAGPGMAKKLKLIAKKNIKGEIGDNVPNSSCSDPDSPKLLKKEK